jgi:hypothetical protein
MNVGDVKNRIAVHFQYQGPQDVRPSDWTQEENLQFEVPAGAPPGSTPLPAVGDTVSLTLTEPGRRCDYRVLSRRIAYAETALGLFVDVHVVVTDLIAQESLATVANSEPVVGSSRRTWGGTVDAGVATSGPVVSNSRWVPKMAAAAMILLAVSASAAAGYVREHRRARELAASNEALTASARQLQADLQNASDRLNALVLEPPLAAPVPIEKAAFPTKARPALRKPASQHRRPARSAGVRKATPPHRYPQPLNAVSRPRTQAPRPTS